MLPIILLSSINLFHDIIKLMGQLTDFAQQPTHPRRSGREIRTPGGDLLDL